MARTGTMHQKYLSRKTSLQRLSLLWKIPRSILISYYHVAICVLYPSITHYFWQISNYPPLSKSLLSSKNIFDSMQCATFLLQPQQQNQPTHALFLGRVWFVRKLLRSLKLQVDHLRFSLAWCRMRAERPTAIPKVEPTISIQVTWHFGTSVFIAFGFFLEGVQRTEAAEYENIC